MGGRGWGAWLLCLAVVLGYYAWLLCLAIPLGYHSELLCLANVSHLLQPVLPHMCVHLQPTKTAAATTETGTKSSSQGNEWLEMANTPKVNGRNKKD